MTAGSDRVHRFAGSPREIGRAAGRALGPRLQENIDRYIARRPQNPGALGLEALRRGALPWLRALPPRFQEELEGLAEGAGVPLQRVAEWAFVESCIADGCSAFVGRIGAHAWVARNNDMFVPGIWGHATIRDITGRIPTVCFGLEGDVFTATGVNRDRLWLHHQALPASDAPRQDRLHLSGWVLLTDMLETCSTIGEVEARLGDVDRDEGMMLFIVDGNSDEFAILECACSSHVRRAPAGQWLVGTNHAYAPGPMTSCPDAPGGSSQSRYARMEALATGMYEREPGVHVPADLIAILADEGVERRGEDFSTVYANVACPGTGELWFSFGGSPAASRGDWQPIAWPW